MSDPFETQRDRLFAIAYRMLGSVAEAEDVVQDAWLAWQRVPSESVTDPASYLAKVVVNRSLDVLRSSRTRRERYVGPWLPEPLVDSPHPVADEIELAESVSMAILVVLESLSPAERAAFLLHDVFGYGYGDLAAMLDRSEAACRQLVSRARGHIQARRPRRAVDPAHADAVADRFFAACRTGHIDDLLATLDPSVRLTSDGGGKVTAALRTIDGADRVARLLVGLLKRETDVRVRRTVVNGGPGAVVSTADGTTVVSVDVAGGAVTDIRMVRNPDKLSHIHDRREEPSE